MEKQKKKKPILVMCTDEQKELFERVAKKTGTMPTTFLRDAALEKCKEIYEKNKKTWIQECNEILRDINDEK